MGAPLPPNDSEESRKQRHLAATLAATVEVERLQARKHALEELDRGFQRELAELVKKRRLAADALKARRRDEGQILQRFSAALNSANAATVQVLGSDAGNAA